MECRDKRRDYRKRIPEFVTGNMPGREMAEFQEHINSCESCREESGTFMDLEKMIAATVVQVPSINITAHVLDKLRKPRKMSVLVKDMVAAWAVAIMLFWFSGPLLSGSNLPYYADEVSKTSNRITTSFSEVYRSYINYSFEALGKVSSELTQFGFEIKKGDEGR